MLQSPDGLALRSGTWAKTGLMVPMSKLPRRTHTGRGSGSLLRDVCSGKTDRRMVGETGIASDYTEGAKGVLAF